MDSNGILSLLGIALRGGNLAVGEDAAAEAAQEKKVRLLLLSSDAAPGTRRRAELASAEGECLLERLPFTKTELGRALGRAAAAVAAVTDLGLAEAVARRLAELDEARYGETARRLALKAKRAAERKKSRRVREKKPADTSGRAGMPPGTDRPRYPKKDKAALSAARKKTGTQRARPSGERRTEAKPYAHSRPVKKGKGSFRRKEERS